jgi:hypothetical protein
MREQRQVGCLLSSLPWRRSVSPIPRESHHCRGERAHNPAGDEQHSAARGCHRQEGAIGQRSQGKIAAKQDHAGEEQHAGKGEDRRALSGHPLCERDEAEDSRRVNHQENRGRGEELSAAEMGGGRRGPDASRAEEAGQSSNREQQPAHAPV